MNRETWKAQEREYAKLIHGERIPVTGKSGSDIPDIMSHTMVGEVKKSNTGACVSQKTLKALRKVKHAGKANNKIAVLFQAHKDKGKRDIEHVVTMYLDDFMQVAKHLILRNESHNELVKKSKDLLI